MKDVCQRRLNQEGITILEVMAGLTIFLIIASFIPAVFTALNTYKPERGAYEEKVLFFVQLQSEFRKSGTYWTNAQGTVLFFDRPGDGSIIRYELYQDKIRRRVNGTGHEVFLQKTGAFRVEENDYGITLAVTSLDSTIFERTVIHPGEFLRNSVQQEEKDEQ